MYYCVFYHIYKPVIIGRQKKTVKKKNPIIIVLYFKLKYPDITLKMKWKH